MVPAGCGMIYRPWSGYDRVECKACRFETLDMGEAKRKLLAQCGVRAVFQTPSQPEEPDLEPSDLQQESHETQEI